MKKKFFKTIQWGISLLMAMNPLSGSAQICSIHDSLQLVTFSRGLSNSFWNLSAPVRSWLGITLTSDGFVGQINLSNRSLRGSISALQLPELEYLYLDNNELTGSIPLLNCPKLKKVFLYLNQLTGPIPNFNLPVLEHLHLHANKLTGQLPNFNLPQLRILQLPHNQLAGNIPNFNLPKLEHLDLSGNFIGGTIPLWNCPMLSWLDVERNRLIGPIPPFTSPIDRILFGINGFTFSDMLPNRFALPNAYITYAPQDSIFKDTTILARALMPFAVSLGIDNAITSNQYQWFKNNAPFGNPTQTNQLIINNLQITDEGIYTCKVTNPNMPALTLHSRKINLVVHTGACSDSTRLLTARQRAMNWGWNPNWQLQSPYLSWAGVHYSGGCADSVYIRRDSMFCGVLGTSFQLSVPNNHNITNATYRWYRNDIWIGTTPNPTFSVFNLTKNDFAKYSVVVEQAGYLPIRLDLGTIQSCCTETQIAPNPTLDITKIYCGGKLGEMIRIYNDIGQLIQTQIATQEPLQLDLSAFQSGVYFVRWGDKTHKILKVN